MKDIIEVFSHGVYVVGTLMTLVTLFLKVLGIEQVAKGTFLSACVLLILATVALIVKLVMNIVKK